ncbi:MAG: tetratricopeptide (TPR) repeat protein, partial [Bradymonadia bacterium]
EGRYADAAPHLQLLSTQKLDGWPRAERAELFYRRGECALALGRRLEAIESLALALEFSVDHLPALAALVRAVGHDPAAYGAGRADDIEARLTAAATARMAAGDTAGRARAESLRGDLLFAQLDIDAALTAWRRAAELHPDDLDVRRPLICAFVHLRRWPDATDELQRFAEGLRPRVTDSPALALRYTEALQWEGDIWCDFAGEPGRAIATYRRVLQVAPDARGARYRMAQAYVLMRDFKEARTVLRSALPQPGETTEPAEHAEHVFYLGRIHALGFQDDRAAAELYQRALQIDPTCSMAMLALARLLDRHDRGPTADKLLTGCAAHIEADPGADPARAILRLYVARRRIKAGDLDGGRTLLIPMAEGDGPLARDARFALVEHAVTTGDLSRAVDQLYTLLDADVTDIDALRRLVDLVPTDDDERRWQVLSVLELLDALTPTQQVDFDALTARAREAVSQGRRALPDDALHRDVLHPSLASPLVELAALCEAALAERFTLGPRPTPPRDAVVTGKRHDLLPDLQAVEAILGTRADVAVTDAPAPVRIWPGAPAMVVLGEGSHQHRRVWVAQALGVLRLGLGRLYALDTPRALELLGVVSALLAPSPGDDPVQRTLVDALPPRAAERVNAVIADVGGAALPARLTGEALLDGLTRTADRLGLLAAARLRGTVDAIAPSGHMPARRGDLPWRLRTGSGAQALARLQDLVKYALSDAYRQARRASGLTL